MLTFVSYKVIRMMPRIPDCYRVLFDCKTAKKPVSDDLSTCCKPRPVLMANFLAGEATLTIARSQKRVLRGRGQINRSSLGRPNARKSRDRFRLGTVVLAVKDSTVGEKFAPKHGVATNGPVFHGPSCLIIISDVGGATNTSRNSLSWSLRHLRHNAETGPPPTPMLFTPKFVVLCT